MRELKSKGQHATNAINMASSYQLVRYRNITYIPADFETQETSVTPAPERTIWQPLHRKQLGQIAGVQYDTLFGSDNELANFDYMVGQLAHQVEDAVTSLLVRTEHGLMELTNQGQLVPATGEFHPNYVLPMLNEDRKHKDFIADVVSGWLNSDEEAESLLRHVATSLAPGWSAVKYILLLGDGRNGKSVMLKMLHALFGNDNVSSVTRQMISQQSPAVIDLNGKLLNLVYDGMAEYLKDSGTEKSLVAGEPVPIRRLYESTVTPVQTNALFMEALNREPKTHDKSSALQKRLVRFHFPNVYPQDNAFERSVLSQESLGAFLSLLVDRYVLQDAVALELMPTKKALQLQVESMFANNIGLQYMKHLMDHGTFGVKDLIGMPVVDLAKDFVSWRVSKLDIGVWSEPDVLAQFQSLVNTERKSKSTPQGPRKVRIITSFKPEAERFIEDMEGATDDAALIEALVDD